MEYAREILLGSLALVGIATIIILASMAIYDALERYYRGE